MPAPSREGESSTDDSGGGSFVEVCAELSTRSVRSGVVIAARGTSAGGRHGAGGRQPQWARSRGLPPGPSKRDQRRPSHRGVRHVAAPEPGGRHDSGARPDPRDGGQATEVASAGWSPWRSSRPARRSRTRGCPPSSSIWRLAGSSASCWAPAVAAPSSSRRCTASTIPGGPERATAFALPAGTHGNSSSEISIQLGLRGPSHVVSTGCTSSTDALGYAFRRIRYGESPLVADRRGRRPDRPWDHDGLRPDEDHGLGLERRAGRGRAGRSTSTATASSWARGPGCSCSKSGSTPWPGACGSTARSSATPAPATPGTAWRSRSTSTSRSAPSNWPSQDAGVRPEQLDYVNLHGTGTELNDRVETAAVKRALGSAAMTIPMSTTKSMIGHPQGACGAAGLVATLLALDSGFLPPTINYEVARPGLRPRLHPQRRPRNRGPPTPSATAWDSARRTRPS